MIPKINGCVDAIQNGVSRVHILDGRIIHCLLLEIFTHKGVGTAILSGSESRYYHVSLNADHKYFYVKVSDSGIGIPEEDIGNIFERFYRVDKSHSTKISGTGLGLAIARNAVVIHRGAIKVYSKVGEGTTFTVRIPLTYVA